MTLRLSFQIYFAAILECKIYFAAFVPNLFCSDIGVQNLFCSNIGVQNLFCDAPFFGNALDGANKYKTIIGDNAFIGSDTQLVAPVTVGAGATIGAGSTITKNTPPDALTFSRSPQKTLSGWQRPRKKRN